jgi:hypothetical protein
VAAFTFIPTYLAVKLTSTITLSATQTAFNSISTWKGATSLTNITGGSPATATSAPVMIVADAAPAALATPSYKISVAYPVATVAKGASSLAMSLAAATVLATLF